MNDILERETRIRDNQIYLVETRNKLKLYESLSDSMEKQRQMSHEYQNQLNVIQGLLEKCEIEELKKYLVSINGELLHDLDRIDAHHAIVNTVINEKYSEARSKGIMFVLKINDMSSLQMENQDIATLLSNLINNAIEACEKVDGKKMIKLKFVHENNRVILSIKNTFDGKVKKIDTDIVTTKKNDKKNHGYGLRNVIHIVRKYQGEYIIKPLKQEFYVSIIIPDG